MGCAASTKAGFKPVADPAVGGVATLGESLAQCGVKKVVLVRHANAEPRDPEQVAADFGEVLKPGAPHAVRCNHAFVQVSAH
jgi:hypothetical protein